jgi:pimeloyl-ACP methyl ester carboxylesterase
VLWSAPESQRAGRPLIVLMHGWSYDERHLFAFAHLFPAQMVVASVRAPYAEAGGYAWFPSRGNPIGDPQPRIANDAAQAVLDWLDTLPPAPSTGLLGFSQGGAMVLQLMRHAPGRFQYGVQLAGSSSMTISPAMRSWPGSGRRSSGDEASVTRSSRSQRSPARNPGWRRTHPRKASDTAGWGTTLPASR